MTIRSENPLQPGTFAVSRRLLLGGVAASAVAGAFGTVPAVAQGTPDALILSIADLHSAYLRLPQLLSVIRSEVEATTAPVTIVLNGDLFELNNVVAVRSRGEADLAFLKALTALAPTIVNLGNHEPDFVDDMAEIVRLMKEAGAAVVSNIVDARTERLYAPLATEIAIGARTVVVPGIATDNLFTYPQPIREQLLIPAPADYARATLPKFAPEPMILLSHAGLKADRAMLAEVVPDGSLVIGGHNHLLLTHEAGETLYAQGGAWGATLLAIAVTAAEAGLGAELRRIDIPADAAGDQTLAALIAALEDEHLTDEDRDLVATLAEPIDLTGGILLAVEAVRGAAGADIAFLGHTTFGTGLPAGEVSRYLFDAFVRFDGDIRTAEVSGAELARILLRANQHEAAAFDERTGDFVYAGAFEIDPKARYTIAANGWTAMNQATYLGTEDLVFTEVPGLALKAVVADALARRG